MEGVLEGPGAGMKETTTRMPDSLFSQQIFTEPSVLAQFWAPGTQHEANSLPPHGTDILGRWPTWKEQDSTNIPVSLFAEFGDPKSLIQPLLLLLVSTSILLSRRS